MKLIDTVTLAEIVLPNELLWQDEFNWSKIASTSTFGTTGSLIIQQGERLEGRPITLGAEEAMDWVTRATLTALQTASKIGGRHFTLKLEYPDDTREFNVIFAPVEDRIEASPVKGFPEHAPDSWWHVKLKFIEVLSV